MAAEALYAKLDKANPGNVVLTAVQMEGKRGWKANFDKIGKGQLSIKDLSGLIDPTQSGEWNFATRIFTETGDALWEWMNHGLDVADKGETTLTHDVDLPDNYDFTIYVVLVKSPWKK